MNEWRGFVSKPRPDAKRARELGFKVESNSDEIILAHIEG